MNIVLDAGHVIGANQSPAYPAYTEGRMAWNLTRMLAEELIKLGHSVTMTRINGYADLPVYDRGLLAGGADLFLSIHSNAVTSEKVRRVVVIPPFANKDGSHDFADYIGKVVTDTMKIQNEPHQVYTRTYVSGGQTYDYYGVVRGAVSAGCNLAFIIEHSFHTNKESAIWLNNPGNLSTLAKNEAKAIDAYFESHPTKKKLGYKVGDKYRLTENDVYTNGKKPAKFAVGKDYTIIRVTESAYLLSEIVSWVKRNDSR